MEIENVGTAVRGDCAIGGQFLTERQLAERWNVSVKLIQKMRYAGTGVPFRKFGALVRYQMNDVLAFEAQHRWVSPGDLAPPSPSPAGSDM